ncbi:unnamed protein product [Blepharisma stoltei]|uniref:Uncharacterized protein n=1 Tax=Blepharisma stoltei TaxID=1481888 RepID=A0AAU9JA35_9CILI|nr:unnamed protein product [Blepharisma stoltei]
MSSSCLKCFAENCPNFPEFLCKCEGQTTLICDDHVRNHCLTDSSHQLSAIPTKMKSEELRKSLSDKINETKTRKHELTEIVFSYIRQLIEKANEITEKCNNLEANYNNLYNREIQSEEIAVSPISIINQIEIDMKEQSNDLENTISNFTSNLKFEAKNDIKARLENQEKEFQNGLNKLYSACNETLQRLFIEDNTVIADQNPFSVIESKINLLYNRFVIIQNFNEELKIKNSELDRENVSLKVKIESSENNSECKTAESPKKRQKSSETRVPNSSIAESDTIISFTENSKILNKFNIQTKAKEQVVLDIPENMTKYTACCQLPDGKIFCYGNYLEDRSYSGIAFIVDKNHQIELLPEFMQCAYSSCAYFEGRVFIFGGKNWEGDLAIAAKYSIAEKTWFGLMNLPVASHGCSVVYYNKDFYISGINHDTLYAYNIEGNNYTRRDIRFKVGVPRIIMCLKYIIFICDSEENYFQSNVGKDWMQGKVAGFPNIIPSSYKTRNEATMLFCCENRYYIFNSKAKEKIKCIASQ